MTKIGRWTAGLLLLALPTFVAAPLLRWFGWRIGRRTRVGFSLLLCDTLALEQDVHIGHLNFFRVRRIVCHAQARVGRANIANGPLSVLLCHSASIGNRNKITRGTSPSVVAWGATLVLHQGARITGDHMIDCTRSIHIGAYSIVAGFDSQLWTHGYVHEPEGPGRYRIDGEIRVGHNVYIGSRCIVNPGVRVVAGTTVGAGAVISRSLLEPGLYVGASLRHLALAADPSGRHNLILETSPLLCERVYRKLTD